MEPAGARGELVRERAEARPDLEDDRPRADVRRVDDAPRDPGIAEKVLPPPLPRTDARGRERRACLPARAHHPRPSPGVQRAPKGRSASAFSARPSLPPPASRGAPASAIIAALSVQKRVLGKSTST